MLPGRSDDAGTVPAGYRRNAGYEYREQIDRRGSGRTLLQHLAGRYRHSSESLWRTRIASGEVRLDGRTVPPETRLRCGQWLTRRRPPWLEPDVPLGFAVLFEDEHLLAVAKPRGLPTLPGGGFLLNTLLARVRERYPEAAPVHRLGRGTSGLVLFARTAEARGALCRAWRDGRVRKLYRGLAGGRPARERFDVAHPIGPVPHPVLGTLHAASPGGKPALSTVRVIEQREGHCLVQVQIQTGRPHQIRIHLAAAGHPLVGDELYGPGGRPAAGTQRRPGELGYRLHALRLELPHPTAARALHLECPAPALLRCRAEGGAE